jgi:hypothetical protein
VRVAVRDAPQDLVQEGLQAEHETGLHFIFQLANRNGGAV